MLKIWDVCLVDLDSIIIIGLTTTLLTLNIIRSITVIGLNTDKQSKKVVDVCCYEGSVHDFEVFKNRYPNMNVDSETLIVCDAGYQGIKKYHERSLSIIKRKPDLELNEYQRKCNKSA